MKKQLTPLLILLAFASGIIIGLLVINYSVIFFILTIPTMIVLCRGAFYEKRWNSILKELQDKKQ